MNEYEINDNVREGIHAFAEEKVNQLFNSSQKEIVRLFKRYWYVTKADKVKIGSSVYNYILIKAPNYLASLFNITAEIIVVFSDYETFEPRTFDAFDNIKEKLEGGRVENLCGVLISKDDNIDNCIKIYNNDKETRIIVPYSYKELEQGKNDSYIFRTKFQRYFYSRDLFAFDDALKTDLYFFGRSQLVMDVISRHKSGQNTGLFGLRKTGKTSILYEIKRRIRLKNAVGVFISCQNPAMSTGSWIDSIFYVVKCLYEEMSMDISSLKRDDFKNTTATDILLNAIQKVYNKTKMSVLLMFDEVEHITYKKAADEKWRDGVESVSFWKAIRSAFQQQNSNFTYCIVGTNPMCIEYATIKNVDNPIFCGVTTLYIPGFDLGQTRSMVRKLGRIMGISFEETLYSKMTEDYGGHPFLIRRLCSFIASQYPERPITIDRVKYAECKKNFNMTQGRYFDMLLDVLKEFYPLEYDMLKYLSMGDIDTFNYFANEDNTLTQHLLGYGIVRHIDDYYDFAIDVIKEYVLNKEKLNKKLETVEDKWKHLCAERCKIEISMRKMVRNVIFSEFKYNEETARKYVMKKIYNDTTSKRKYATYSLNDLFDPDKSQIYLKDLKILINGKWDCFAIFMKDNSQKDISQEEFNHMMDVLNQDRRFDAHAKIPDENTIQIFNSIIINLNACINTYNNLIMN